jgi:hypothetical protein
MRLFNSQVDYVRALHDKSFTLSGSNYQLNATNLASAQTSLAVRAEVLIRAIDRAIGPAHLDSDAPSR